MKKFLVVLAVCLFTGLARGQANSGLPPAPGSAATPASVTTAAAAAAAAQTTANTAQTAAATAQAAAVAAQTTANGAATSATVAAALNAWPAQVYCSGLKANAVTTTGTINAGSPLLTLTTGSFVAGDVGKLVVVEDVGSTPLAATLSSALSGTVTAIPVNALAVAIPSGTVLYIQQSAGSAFVSQTFITTAAAAAGATSLTIASTVVNQTYASGLTLQTPITHLYTTIASVSGGVATLAANATYSPGTIEFTYGSDDTATAQACITAAFAKNGTALFPTGQIAISAPLTTPAAQSGTIAGMGVQGLWGILSQSGAEGYNTVAQPPYITGTVFVQMSAGVDGIDYLGQAVTQSSRDYGIRFAGAYSNTGHGQNEAPSAQVNGLMDQEERNIKVFGHDGNHYAFRRVSQEYGRGYSLSGFGGGGEIFDVNSPVPTGNWIEIGGYFFDDLYGTANGVQLQTSYGGEYLDFMDFLRPQIWMAATYAPPTTQPTNPINYTAPTASGQLNWNCPASNNAVGIVLQQPDFETNPPGGGAILCYNTSDLTISGGHSIPTLAINNLGGGMPSGTALQNTSGGPIRLDVSYTFNPTSSVAATFVAVTGPNSSPSTATGCNLTVPANGATGQTLSCGFTVPPNYWYKATYANVTNIANTLTHPLQP